jgi:hypothetical protein
MKHGKKLTREMKKLLTKARMNTYDWYYIKNLPEELHLVHRNNTEIKKIINKNLWR